MRVMVLVKASEDSETGRMPSTEELTAMTAYNEELVAAGVMVAGEGLQPSTSGVRVRFDGAERTVLSGPFSPTTEQLAGFWIWKVRDLDEAVEWLKKAPFDGGAEVELRAVFETEDFGDAMTPELREAEDRLREQVPGVA